MKRVKQISAGGIVFRCKKDQPTPENTEWLVIQHSGHKGWTFPKGLVGDHNPDESKQEAALREVEEEGGVKAEILDPEPVQTSYTFRWEDMLIDKTVYYFLMRYLSGDPKDHDWEVSEALFLPVDKVRKILTYKSDKQAFEKILQKLQNLHPTQ